MTPSSSCASVDEVGQALEGEGSDGHGPRGGNGARRCAVSLDGVPLRPDGDGEACRASSGTVSGADGTRLKTLSFGPETGKTTALLAAEVARKVRPDTGRRRRARQLDVSRKAPARRAGGRLLSRLRTSRRSCRPSATDWYDRAARRTASTRSAIRYLRDKATTKTATAVLERELRFFRRHRRRMRCLKAGGSGVVRQQGAGQPAHETGALERRRRPERPHLQGVVGPLRRCVAGDTERRERQPERRRSLMAEAYRQNRDVEHETGFLQK